MSFQVFKWHKGSSIKDVRGQGDGGGRWNLTLFNTPLLVHGSTQLFYARTCTQHKCFKHVPHPEWDDRRTTLLSGPRTSALVNWGELNLFKMRWSATSYCTFINRYKVDGYLLLCSSGSKFTLKNNFNKSFELLLKYIFLWCVSL